MKALFSLVDLVDSKMLNEQNLRIYLSLLNEEIGSPEFKIAAEAND